MPPMHVVTLGRNKIDMSWHDRHFEADLGNKSSMISDGASDITTCVCVLPFRTCEVLIQRCAPVARLSI